MDNIIIINQVHNYYEVISIIHMECILELVKVIFLCIYIEVTLRNNRKMGTLR